MAETIGIAIVAWPNHPKRLEYVAETIELCDTPNSYSIKIAEYLVELGITTPRF